MAARQQHGFLYQANVISRLLNLKYTDKWDIPKHISDDGIPGVIKCIRWGNVIYLGDALRQYDIENDFNLVISFYKKKNGRKVVVFEEKIFIKIEKWKHMWGNLTREKLIDFISFVKSKEYRNITGQKLKNFRKEVQKRKRELMKDYTGKITINPKIDSKTQRRVQCGIPFMTFIEEFGVDLRIMKKSKLYGGINLENINLGS